MQSGYLTQVRFIKEKLYYKILEGFNFTFIKIYRFFYVFNNIFVILTASRFKGFTLQKNPKIIWMKIFYQRLECNHSTNVLKLLKIKQLIHMKSVRSHLEACKGTGYLVKRANAKNLSPNCSRKKGFFYGNDLCSYCLQE